MDTYDIEELAQTAGRRRIWVQVALVMLALILISGATYVGLAMVKTSRQLDFKKGVILWCRGDYAAAVPHFESVAAREPLTHEVHALLAAAYVRLGEIDRGISKYRTMLNARPDDNALRQKLAAALVAKALKIKAQSPRSGQGQTILFLAREQVEQVLAKDPDNGDARYTLGEIEAASERPKAAEEQLAKAVKLDPKHLAARRKLIEMYRTRGDLNAAEKECRDAIKKAGDPDGFRAELATVLEAKGRPDEAKQIVAQLVAKQPKNARARERLAFILLKQGAHDQALNQAEKALALSAGLLGARLVKGYALLHKKEYRRAEAELTMVLRARPEMPELRWGLALACIGLKQDQRAMVHLNALVKLVPDFTVGRLALAKLSLNAGLPDEAMQQAQVVLGTQGDNVRAQRLLAGALVQRKDFKGAKTATEEWAKLAPDSPAAHLNLAGLELFTGRAGVAIEDYVKAMDLAPDNVHLRYIMGLACARRGDLRSAAAQFKEVLRRQPGYLLARLGLARVYGRSRRWKLAETECKKALDRSPDAIGAISALANIYERQGKYDDAIGQWRALLAHKPDNPGAGIRLANAHWLAKQRDEAIKILDRLHRAHPKSQRLAMVLASAYLRSGNDDAAARLLTKLADAAPKDALPRLALARLALKREDWHAAAGHFEMLRKAAPKLPAAYMGGLIRLRQGRPQEARAVFEAADRSLDDNLLIQVNLVGLYLLTGDSTKAAELGEALKDKHENARTLVLLLANASATRGDAKRAGELVREAWARDPKKVEAYLALLFDGQLKEKVEVCRHLTEMLMYMNSRWAREAIRECERLLVLRPGNFFLATTAAELYGAARDRDKQAAMYRRLAERFPDSPIGPTGLARLALQRGDRRGATGQLRQALERAPQLVIARITLAAMLLGDGKTDAAIKQAAQAHKMSPQDPRPLRILVDACLAKGKVDEAEPYVRKLADLSPDSARRGWTLATLAFIQGKFGECITLCQALQQTGPISMRAAMLLARARLAKRQPWQAFQALEQALKVDPTYVPALAMAGDVLRSARSPFLAKEYLKRALAINPDDVGAHMALASVALQLGRLDEAQRHYVAVSHKRPRYLPAKLALAQLYARKGNDAQARKLAAQVIEAAPKSLRPRALLVSLHRSKGDAPGAIKALEKLVQAQPQSLAAAELALLRLDAGDPGKALEALSPYMKAQRAHPRVLLTAALVHLAQRHFDAALAACDQADAAAKRPVALLTRLGALLLTGRAEAAENLLRQSRGITALRRGAYLELTRLAQDNAASAQAAAEAWAQAAALESAGWPGLAKPKAQLVWQALPGNIMAAALLDRCHRGLGQAQLSIPVYERVLEIHPGSGPAHDRLGQLLVAKGDLVAGMRHMEESIELGPKSAATLVALGSLRERRRDYDGAITSYKDALAIAPASVVALNNLAWLYATQRPDKLDDALALAEKARHVAPFAAEVADTLGWIHHLKGDGKKAVASLQLAARMKPLDPAVHYRYAMASLTVGDKSTAAGELKRALELGPTFVNARDSKETLQKLGKGKDAGQLD